MKAKSIHQDVYISTILFVILIFFFVQSSKLPSDSAIFPKLLIGLLGFLNCFVLYDGVKKTKSMNAKELDEQNPIHWRIIKVPLVVFLITAMYVVLFKLTNYFIASTIFIIALMKLYKVKSWKIIMLIAIVFNAIVYIGFVKMLHVPLI